MLKYAYALYDVQEMELHIFAANADVLAKDAVSAFLSQTVIPQHWASEEDAQEMLAQISATSGPVQLQDILEAWDFKLAMILV